MELKIQNLSVSVKHKEIIRDISLSIKTGEVHVIMGPNGSGKSTLSLALAGHPDYTVTNGKILINNLDITGLSPEKRAQLGLFLAFQKPLAVAGVGIINFLKTAYMKKNPGGKDISIRSFLETVKNNAGLFKLNEEFLKRGLNDGFSGGEAKKLEMLQMAVLKPDFSILDEIDTGLDVDALKTVATGIETFRKEMGIILITHYQRILKYLKPDAVHIMIDGKIAESGGFSLVKKIEEKGYENYI